MPKRMSLDQLDKFLADARSKVEAVAGELAEVQTQFVSAHQVNQTLHDATLSDLCARAAYDLNTLPPDVRRAIDERTAVERETLEKRRQELLSQIVPKAEQIADDLLQRAQAETDKVRQLNPRLDKEEERVKASLAQMQAELNQLNAEIKRRSGCLVFLINFFKVNELDRKRQKLLGRMEENAKSLKDVRDEWAKARAEYATDEAKLREAWQAAAVSAAQAREELAQLQDDGKREGLALQRAIFYVFDHWGTPLGPAGQPLLDEINQMVHFNAQQDAYEKGLGQVAGFIALLGGVTEGLKSLGQSVDAILQEQKMHSSYLKPVSLDVADQVIVFHRQWDDLRSKVKNEQALVQHPADFSALFERETQGPLSQKNIEQMFGTLGQSLKQATQGWKG